MIVFLYVFDSAKTLSDTVSKQSFKYSSAVCRSGVSLMKRSGTLLNDVQSPNETKFFCTVVIKRWISIKQQVREGTVR